MTIFLTSLLIFLCNLVLGVLLRFLSDKATDDDRSWTKQSKDKMKYIKNENIVLFILLALTGLIENLSIFCMIIGIPLYFILGI